MDVDDDELIVTNFSELKAYIGQTLIKGNYESFKHYLKYKKASIEKCFGRVRKSEIDAEELTTTTTTTLEEIVLLKPNPVQKTRLHIDATKNTENALDYYLRLFFKLNEKIVDFEFIDEVIARGADLNYVSKEKENVLFLAVRHENEDLVRYLLEKDINVRQINSIGLNIFHVAALNQSANILRRLALEFQRDDLEQLLAARTPIDEQTVLHYAAKEGSCSIVECLITEFNVNKEAQDSKNRTPLYIAAEFNRKNIVQFLMKQKCCVSFTDSTRRETLNNIKGQTALYWIVTKMPDIAKEALDLLYEPNQYLRKDKHYLAALEPRLVENDRKNEVLPKSVLSSIVEAGNLDLIVHPTINCLIDIKWKKFGRKRAWFDFLLTIVYVAVWIAFGVWIPYNDRHNYDFSTSADRFRLCLFIIGILFTLYLIVTEIREVVIEYRYQKKSNKLRGKELQEYRASFRRRISNEKSHFIKEEESFLRQSNKFSVIYNYLSDTWNLYDWASIMMLIACIASHVDDIVNHTEYKARLHIRLMAITIIIISIRLLKSSRIIIPKFGTLVMILYYSISDMIIWFILYLVIWLSFSCSFWMIYGGTKYDKSMIESSNGDCFSFDNCTTVAFERFDTYDLTAYTLYRLTFGEPFDEAELNQIDDRMLNPLIGSYVGVTSLVLVNIFIALLTTTFERVYEKAGAHIRLQRGIEILNKEKSMSYEERKDHIQYLHRVGSPYVDHRYNETITTLEDRVSNLEKETKEQNKLLTNINKSFDKTNSVTREYISFNNNRLNKLQSDVNDLKEVLNNFLQVQMNVLNEMSRISNENTPPRHPKFDFLNYKE